MDFAWRRERTRRLGADACQLLRPSSSCRRCIGMLTVTWQAHAADRDAAPAVRLTTLWLLWWLWLTLRAQPRAAALALGRSPPVAWRSPTAAAARLALHRPGGAGGADRARRLDQQQLRRASPVPDLPTCQGSWWPQHGFPAAPSCCGTLTMDYEGGCSAIQRRASPFSCTHLGRRCSRRRAGCWPRSGCCASAPWRACGARRCGAGGLLGLQLAIGISMVLRASRCGWQRRTMPAPPCCCWRPWRSIIG